METKKSDSLTYVFFPLRDAMLCDFKFLFLLELYVNIV